MARNKKQQAAIAMSMKAKGTKLKKAQFGEKVTEGIRNKFKSPDMPKEGPVKEKSMLQEDRGNEGWNAYIEKLKTTGVPGTKQYEMLKNQQNALKQQKKGGRVTGSRLVKKNAGGSLGMKSVNSGYDNNKKVTRADFVAMGKGQAKVGGSYRKGGTTSKKK